MVRRGQEEARISIMFKPAAPKKETRFQSTFSDFQADLPFRQTPHTRGILCVFSHPRILLNEQLMCVELRDGYKPQKKRLESDTGKLRAKKGTTPSVAIIGTGFEKRSKHRNRNLWDKGKASASTTSPYILPPPPPPRDPCSLQD